MDDLISRQAAIDALNMQAEEMSHWSERYQEQRRGVLTAVNIVADCPSIQSEQRWIPCSERLPEERGLYLTTTKNKEVYCDYWNEDNFDRTEMVIAWMPLPESYQEGGE